MQQNRTECCIFCFYLLPLQSKIILLRGRGEHALIGGVVRHDRCGTRSALGERKCAVPLRGEKYPIDSWGYVT